jgi:release factor glutamine methyltransferase
VLDLGTGTGALAITLKAERSDWAVTAIDLSADALALAQANATKLLGGADQVNWVNSDWFSNLPNDSVSPFQLIVSNPPYIAHGDEHLSQGDVRFEPAMALVSGARGMDAIERICSDAPRYLAGEGLLVIEHGYDQKRLVHSAFAANGFSEIQCLQDLAGLDRVTIGVKK